VSDRAHRLARALEFQAELLSMIVEDFEPSDWSHRPMEGGSDAAWILGHLVHSKAAVASRLGVGDVPEWAGRFGMGTGPESTAGDSTIDERLGAYRSLTANLVEALRHLPPSREAETWDMPFPGGTDGLLDGVDFFYAHEQYHLGQLGYLRRGCGKEGFERKIMEKMAASGEAGARGGGEAGGA